MLLATAQRLEKMAQRPIPVKCNQRKMIGGPPGGNGGYSRGVMLGVEGSRIRIRPKNHNTVELYEPENVRIWVARAVSDKVLTRQQVDELMEGEKPTNGHKGAVEPLINDSLAQTLLSKAIAREAVAEVKAEEEIEEVIPQPTPIPEAVIPVAEIPAVVAPSPEGELHSLFSNAEVRDAVLRMQRHMQNADAAIDMLNEERKNLLLAQEALVAAVAKQIQAIDNKIAESKVVIDGRRG